MLATAGDLVFSGSIDGYVYALDAVSGEELWHIAVGSRVHSAPMTFAVDGKQYLAVPIGGGRIAGSANTLFVFAVPSATGMTRSGGRLGTRGGAR